MNQLPDLLLKDQIKCEKVKKSLEKLILSSDDVERIKEIFGSEMKSALEMQPSSLQMENTYIPELPDGTENGDFLALDLGGTNLRVLLMQLAAGEVTNEIIQYFDIPEDLRVGSGERLFEYLAASVDSFARVHKLQDDRVYPMGFTFSFPMRQNALDSGLLVTWTKSFNCPSIVGKDAAQILREQLRKKGRTNIEVVAILNDTTGTLIHGAKKNKNTRIGIVLGTGSNACYVENASRVKKWKMRHNEKNVIVDIEWGAFGDNNILSFMRTTFDDLVDEGSLLKQSFTFEKYIGGKYLGELCRVILAHLRSEGLFLPNMQENKFPKPWRFGSDNVSMVENGTLLGTWEHSQIVLSQRFGCKSDDYTVEDLEILKYVCGLISFRAAQLVAINTSVLINWMAMDGSEGEAVNDIAIAIDGSVYKNHPRLRKWISDFTTIWAPTVQCNFIMVEDGSGKGAALAAAIADKLRKQRNN